MNTPDMTRVDSIREASRRIVRLLGFMQPTLAGTQYPPSAVHTILEVGARGCLTAVQLSEILGLEKSSVSRLVRKLVEAGELVEAVDNEDGRVKLLSLTAKGKVSLESIARFGRAQVISAMDYLPEIEQTVVSNGLAMYAQALEADHKGLLTNPMEHFEIRSGYIPGVVGRVAEMHAAFYTKQSGFGQFFESKVATGMAEFTGRLQSSRNGLWVAMYRGSIVGSIAIDGESLGKNSAHLRWFIVADGLRGLGIGKLLLQEAVSFCEKQQFGTVQLWTFKGLNAARKLYESCGFSLADEYVGEQWGLPVTEQRFERALR